MYSSKKISNDILIMCLKDLPGIKEFQIADILNVSDMLQRESCGITRVLVPQSFHTLVHQT